MLIYIIITAIFFSSLSFFISKKFLSKSDLSNQLDIAIDIFKGNSNSPLVPKGTIEHKNVLNPVFNTPYIINPKSTQEHKFNELLEIIEQKQEEDLMTIGEINLTLGRIGRGELEEYVRYTPSKSVFIELIHQIDITKKNLLSVVKGLGTAITLIKNNNYKVEIDKQGTFKDIRDMLVNMEECAQVLTEEAISDIELSKELDLVVNALEENISSLSSNSTKQAANLEETSASVQEIAGNIRMIAEKTKQMNQNAIDGLKMSHSGLEELKKTTESVNSIGEFQKKIDESTKVIEQIAFQTNILSLNAAVEAATAGEHGKGFAVVATEVRNLAAKSAEAATEIKSLVSESIKQAEEGTLLVKQTLESFTKVVEEIEKNQSLIDEVGDGISEQDIGMSQISEIMNSLDSFTQDNARVASDTQNLSAQVSEACDKIKQKVDKKII